MTPQRCCIRCVLDTSDSYIQFDENGVCNYCREYERKKKFIVIGKSQPQYAHAAQENGAGEILLTSIEREGTGSGYDLELVKNVSSAIKISLIACGGAKNPGDFKQAFNIGASAAAAGSMFFFTGILHAVLISYPDQTDRF